MITNINRSVRYFLILLAVCLMVSSTVVLSGCKTNKLEVEIIRSDMNGNSPQEKIPFPQPDSHDAGWPEYHGRLYKLNWSGSSQQENSCYTCHYESECIQCHNVKPPRDHTNTWRTLSQGFEAAGDR